VQEVEEILDSRWRGNKLQYLIKWKGQLLEERTWENRDKVVQGAPRSCREFHKKHPESLPSNYLQKHTPTSRGHDLRRGVM